MIYEQRRISNIFSLPGFIYPTQNYHYKFVLNHDRVIDAVPYCSRSGLTSWAVFIYKISRATKIDKVEEDELKPVRGLWIVPCKPTFEFNADRKLTREDLTDPKNVKTFLEDTSLIKTVKKFCMQFEFSRFLLHVDNYGISVYAHFRPAPWIRAEQEYRQGNLLLARVEDQIPENINKFANETSKDFFNHQFPEEAKVFYPCTASHDYLTRFVYFPSCATITSSDHPAIIVPPGFYLAMHPPPERGAD